MDQLLSGFLVVLEPQNLLYVFLGVLIGNVIGVLPGLGPSATIALLLPITYTMEPTSAIIMLAGIYYGSMYGGTITSVLLRMPGEAASVVTTFDGYQMARQGRAGPALAIAAIGSFVGGTVAVVGLSLLAPQLAELAVRFGPPEYAALTVLGIVLVAYLGTRSLLKAVIAAAFGLLLATVGQDPITGTPRFTLGLDVLFGGLEFVAIAMGLFGIGEIIYNLETRQGGTAIASKIRGVWPSRQDLRDSRGPIMRGSVIGFFIGILPGGGGIVSSLASYSWEKRRSRRPERFGRGAIEGVAGPETANNAGSTSAFIPLLTLGIPSNAVLALVFGALLLHGITPGPQLVGEHPEIFWGVIASMYLGNLLLLALNIPLVGVFVRMLRVRATVLLPLALLVTLAGVYSVNNSVFDMWVVVAFGAIGYLMRKSGYEPGPLVLAFVLGTILERSFRQSMLLGDGSLGIFLTRPFSGTLLALTAVVIGVSIWRAATRRTHDQPPAGEEAADEPGTPQSPTGHEEKERL